jgi:hypothetical protein
MDVINGPNPIITHNGVKVLECLYGDGIWLIEHYPLKSKTLFGIAKNIKHYYKAKIISKQIDRGTPIPCYVGY